MSKQPTESPASRFVRIEWCGPFSPKAIASKRGKDDYGLYQIYGRHVVFGAGALLYVGKAVERAFAKRFSEHAKWLRYESDTSVLLGRVARGDYADEPDWESLVSDVEALTIYWHSPPYNSQNIVSYNGQSLHVQNWGDRGALMPEYTSHWLPLRPEETT